MGIGDHGQGDIVILSRRQAAKQVKDLLLPLLTGMKEHGIEIMHGIAPNQGRALDEELPFQAVGGNHKAQKLALGEQTAFQTEMVFGMVHQNGLRGVGDHGVDTAEHVLTVFSQYAHRTVTQHAPNGKAPLRKDAGKGQIAVHGGRRKSVTLGGLKNLVPQIGQQLAVDLHGGGTGVIQGAVMVFKPHGGLPYRDLRGNLRIT